jgi:hypothetical protein
LNAANLEAEILGVKQCLEPACGSGALRRAGNHRNPEYAVDNLREGFLDGLRVSDLFPFLPGQCHRLISQGKQTRTDRAATDAAVE